MNSLAKLVRDVLEPRFDTEWVPVYQPTAYPMKVDVSESKENITLVADLPGYSMSDVDVTIKEHVLNIRATRNKETEKNGKQYHIKERFTGEIQRSFRLGEDIDEANVDAALENGLLTIVLPKFAEDRNQKRIEIKGSPPITGT